MRLVLQKMEYRRVYWKHDYVCNCFSSLILIDFLIGFSDWLILITGLSSQSVFLFGWFCVFRLIFVKYHICLFSVICRSFSRSSGLNKSISSNIFIAGSDISTVNFGTENEWFTIKSHPMSWPFFAKEVNSCCHLAAQTLSYFTNFRHTKKRQSVNVVGLCRGMTVKMRSILTFDYSLFDKFVEQVPPKWHLKIGFRNRSLHQPEVTKSDSTIRLYLSREHSIENYSTWPDIRKVWIIIFRCAQYFRGCIDCTSAECSW